MKNRSHRHKLGLIVLSALSASACDLPPVPLDLAFDAPRDLPLGPPIPTVCIPEAHACQENNSVLVRCSPDGRSQQEVTRCGEHTFCSEAHQGCILPLDACEGTNKPYLFTADMLSFDVSAERKDSEASLFLVNCAQTPLTLRSASLNSPRDDGGLPIFRLGLTSRELSELQLPPRTTLPLSVIFSPRRLNWQEYGKLSLTLIPSGVEVQEIDLRTRTACVGATPQVQLGALTRDREASLPVRVHNCGAVRVEVTGWERFNAQNEVLADEGPPQPPFALEPGESREVRLPYRPHTLGPVQLRLRPRITLEREVPPVLLPETQVLGVVHNGRACVDAPTLPARIIRNVEPFQNVTLASDESAGYAPHLSWTGSQPAWPQDEQASMGSPEPHELPKAPVWPQPHLQHTREEAQLTPVAAGDYLVEVSWLAPSGALACQRSVLDVKARPRAPLYLELAMNAEGDPIPEDGGHSRHPLARLMVTSTPEGAEAPGQDAWRDQLNRCVAQEGHATQCSNEQARVLSHPDGLNQLGVIAADNAALNLRVGVEMVNRGMYDQSVASLRVWHRGELWEFDAPPSRQMLGPRVFWDALVYEGADVQRWSLVTSEEVPSP